MGFSVFSVYCGTRERVDWNPDLRVGFLYLDQVQALERAFRVKSGVESPVGDELEIDAEVFGEFLKNRSRSIAKAIGAAILVVQSSSHHDVTRIQSVASDAWLLGE